MTPDYVLSKIINHEMLVEEATHVKNLSKGVISSRKQDIAFKGSKESKKIVEESSNKEEDDDSDDESTRYDSDEMTLFIRRFSKMMTKQNFFKGGKKDKFRSKTKRACYNYGKYGHYIANYPHEHMDEENDKKKKRKRRDTRKISITRRKAMMRLTLTKSGTRMMRVLTSIVMVWPPWQSRAPLLQVNLSSPILTKGNILASWQRRVEER
jgi:hypothetical protein